jgi:hypothetical protein
VGLVGCDELITIGPELRQVDDRRVHKIRLKTSARISLDFVENMK